MIIKWNTFLTYMPVSDPNPTPLLRYKISIGNPQKNIFHVVCVELHLPINSNVFILWLQMGGIFVMSKFDRCHLRRYFVSGLCLSKKNAEVVKYPSEHIEIEENEYYNGMEKGINHIPYVESNEESHYT